MGYQYKHFLLQLKFQVRPSYKQIVRLLTALDRYALLTMWFLSIKLIVPLPVMAQETSNYMIRVALFVDRGASVPSKKAFKRELDQCSYIKYSCVYGDDIRDGALKNFDALIIPGGSAAKDAYSLGPEAQREVRRFVNDGGIYMGVCAGAYLSSSARENYLGLLPLKTVDSKHWYRVNEGTPVDVQLTAGGMEVFGVDHDNLRITYENGPIFAPPPSDSTDSSLTPLGFFKSEVVADGGERGVMVGAPAMVLSRYGKGIVLAISPHPEQTNGLHKMESHALKWMYEHRTSMPTRSSNSKQ